MFRAKGGQGKCPRRQNWINFLTFDVKLSAPNLSVIDFIEDRSKVWPNNNQQGLQSQSLQCVKICSKMLNLGKNWDTKKIKQKVVFNMSFSFKI